MQNLESYKKIYDAENCYYEGQMIEGKRQGFGSYLNKNGDRFDGEWKDDKIDGVG